LRGNIRTTPSSRTYVALYEEIIDLRTAIKEKDVIVKEQNSLIKRLESQLNEVAAILCDHEKQLNLSQSVVDTDGTISYPLGEQEVNVFRLLQGVMVDLLDLDDIYEASEVSPEDLGHDADPTTTNQTQQNPSQVIPAKNFSIFDKPQPKATPPKPTPVSALTL
jgi:hypothetical protein